MKITIVIPVYNVEKYLSKCLKSVVEQTYKNIEIILINDGSTDHSLDICKKYLENDKRILLYTKQNGGLSDARNYGIERATGEYILFLDSDDFIERDTCEKISAYLKNNKEIEILCGCALKITGEKKEVIYRKSTENKVISGKDYLKKQFKESEMFMATWLNIYKNSFLKEKQLKFVKGLLHEDEEFTPRAFLVAEKVLGVDLIFYNYLIRENSITTQKDKTKNAEHMVQICKNLDTLYDSIEDIELKKLLKNDLFEKYLHIFQVAKLYKRKYSYLIDKNFLKNKAISKKNKMKYLLFKRSITGYFILNTLLKKMKGI